MPVLSGRRALERVLSKIRIPLNKRREKLQRVMCGPGSLCGSTKKRGTSRAWFRPTQGALITPRGRQTFDLLLSL